MAESGSICFRREDARVESHPTRRNRRRSWLANTRHAGSSRHSAATAEVLTKADLSRRSLDEGGSIGFAGLVAFSPMKTSFRLLAVTFVLSFATFASAGDFISTVLQSSQTLTITVNGDHALVIRNFTQEVGGLFRGVVSVTKNGLTITNAFVASLEDPSSFSILDPINQFVVAGPASVTVTCGDTTSCFITYRKAEE